MTDQERSALRMKEAMGEKNITAAELAQRSGVNKGTISHYVNGKNIPTNINASKLAVILDVSPAWLMGLPVDKHGAAAPKHTIDVSDLTEGQLLRLNSYLTYIRNGGL